MNVKRRNKTKEEEEDEDSAFSKLPKDLLCQILSFLSTREAALTSVLSKRWRDLFIFIPSLDLDDSIFVPCERRKERTSFVEFVNRVLALQSNSPITKFSLTYHKGLDEQLLGDWIHEALRRGATDLTLKSLSPSRLHLLPLPTIFHYGQNLMKLRLGCGNLGLYRIRGGDFVLKTLRTLHLDSNDLGFDRSGFDMLLAKCPVLEELVVSCLTWSCGRPASVSSVSSPTLKRLTIDCEHDLSRYESLSCPISSSHWGTPHPQDVSFDTPNLICLNYSEFLACSYPLVELDSLVEARLDVGYNLHQMRVRDSDEFGVRWDATNLVMGIHNVQTLHLTSDTLEVISDFCKTVPVFHNLNHLSIESDGERGWEALPLLLINCPKLQTLVFHGLHHLITDGCGDVCDCISLSSSSLSSCLTSCPVKILKILDFGATCRAMSLAQHFLKNLPQLEEATVVLQLDSSLEENLHLFQILGDTRDGPKGFTKLQVESC